MVTRPSPSPGVLHRIASTSPNPEDFLTLYIVAKSRRFQVSSRGEEVLTGTPHARFTADTRREKIRCVMVYSFQGEGYTVAELYSGAVFGTMQRYSLGD